MVISLEESKSNNNLIKIDFSEKIYLKDEMSNYEYNLLGIISEIQTMDKNKKKYVYFILKKFL